MSKENTSAKEQKKEAQSTQVGSSQPAVAAGKTRNWLIFGTVGLFAAIIFGLLYIFVIAPSAPTGGAGWSAGWFLFSFAAGLTMIVLPCTLPLAFVIVPLSMGKGLLRGVSMALAFGIGVTVTLSIYGILAALLGGAAIDTLGADIEVVKNWVYTVAGIFALIFALSEVGLMNIHMPTYSGAAPAFIQKKQEIFKAFLLGLFLGNIGVGCPHPATPLILIEIATSGDVLYGWLMFLVHAVGRVLPLMLLAFLAILGVNGLNWLMSRKDTVERVTGWAMVFVAGFILTLGLFTHDWWVNSGIHTALEAVTQESTFNTIFNENLDTEVEHAHGLEEGVGLFGQPLWWGHWFLVLVWLVPIWLWYRKRRKEVDAEADECEERLLSTKRNFLIAISIFLVLMFAYFMPQNFYYKSISGDGHGAHDDHAEQHLEGLYAMDDGTIMNAAGEVIEGAHMADGMIELSDGTMVKPSGMGMDAMRIGDDPFVRDLDGLPQAVPTETVTLSDGDTYDIEAYYVQKEVGNRTLKMMSYNGSVPGPFIKAPEGAEITINFTNNTDIDQTIHSHGVRVDNRFDGVPNATQDSVTPGETFTYTINFRDGGAYWYHPHTREDYAQELGLYGNYLIDPEIEYQTPVNREVPLIIDDILIENEKIAQFYKDTTNFALLGRHGNEFLVNGQQDYTLTAQAGEVVRFFITNVSNARTYNLSLPGAEMKLVGADVGKYERETFASELLISPAERLIVEAYFEEAGTYSLLHTPHGGESIELTRVLVEEQAASPSYASEFNTLHTNDSVVETFADFRNYRAAEPDKRLLLTVDIEAQIDHSAHAHGDHNDDAPAVDHDEHAHSQETSDRLAGIQWNDPSASDRTNTTETIKWKLIDQETGKESMNIPVSDWTFQEGDLVKMRLTNDEDADHVMQHPIHLHGQRFVVLSENGVPNDNLVWKDTALVFPGESMDILVEMSNPGEWMTHCHISEHLHAGMMMTFRVEDEQGNAPGDAYRASSSAVHSAEMSDSESDQTMQSDLSEYTFSTDVPPSDYSVEVKETRLRANTMTELALTLRDASGERVTLSKSVARPLRVIFVDSSNANKVVTYPGNTSFDDFIPSHGDEGHDNSDGHHDTELEHGEPAHDNSDGHHGFIPRAYAAGDHDGGHSSETGDTVYDHTMPIAFEARGHYKAFVEFVPQGQTDVEVVSFDMEVAADAFSIDNFGWSETTRWTVLFVTSILLAGTLSLIVRRFVIIKE